MTDFERLIGAAEKGNVDEVRAVLRDHAELINQKDSTGATALHYAAFGGHRFVVHELVHHGADVNVRDNKFGATPSGWAIEYLREVGGLLGIEMEDFAHAIRRGEVEWVTRFLRRFPALRTASDSHGKPFQLLARESGNQEIANLFSP
jgi:Ankyrin repeats (3 copies)